MTQEPTNADRAAWAKQALAVFTGLTYGGEHPDTMDGDDRRFAVTDLIADLFHYAHQQGYDVGSIVYGACGHFGAEICDESCDASRQARQIESALADALDYLLQQTVDQDLNHGITLSEGEAEARRKALAAIANASQRQRRRKTPPATLTSNLKEPL